MTREQRLFAAARHLRELNPVDPAVNFCRVGTSIHTHHQAVLAAQKELDAALSAYEFPQNGEIDNGSR
jgi:hypothetical protein